VNDWVDAGGGTIFDPVSDADAFLEFAAGHLSEPSPAMTICRMEQAAYRASTAALRFKPPDLSLLDHPKPMLCTGKGAALVRFFAEPQRLFALSRRKRSFRLYPLCWGGRSSDLRGASALMRTISKQPRQHAYGQEEAVAARGS
jgi:hypothetical protein